MAIQTRRSQGSWSSVSTAPSYAGVVSQYATQIKAAQVQQENTELENKVFEYQQGNIKFNDLNAFINGRLSGVTAGTQKELDLKKLLVEVDKFENKKNLEIKRAGLEAKFAKNGISADEQLQIEREMLQYLKEGTSDYTQQLSTIAATQELARVEKNNMEVAKLESELSREGLTTSESIRIFEKMKGFTEQGSAERSQIDTKLNGLKEAQKEEQLAQAREIAVSEMLDQYVEGGFTEQEKLEFTRNLLGMSTPGTKEYNDLKFQEAKILDSIASEARSSGESITAAKNQIEAYMSKIEYDEGLLEDRFKEGNISVHEYLSGKKEFLAAKQELFEANAEIVARDEGLSSKMGKTTAQLEEQALQEEQLKKGNLIPIIKNDGSQELVDRNNIKGLTALAKKANIANQEGFLDEGVPVLTVNLNGKKTEVALRPDGSFEILQKTEDLEGVDYQGLGQTYNPGASVNPELAKFSGPKIEPKTSISDKGGLPDAVKKVASSAAAAVTPPGLKTAVSLAKGVSKDPAKALTTANKVSKVAGLSTPVGLASQAISTVKDLVPSSISTPDFSSVDNLLKGLSGSVLGAASQAKAKLPTLKGLFKSTPGKINIGPLNLPEFGVSEKLSSLLGKAKSFVSGLFK